MKRSFLPLLLSVLALIAQSATAQILYNNSNIQTGTGNGFMGANTSSIAAGSTTFGFSNNGTGATQIFLADQFTLASTSMVTSISFVAYSTSNYPFPPTSPFTSATLSIFSGAPGSGNVALFTSNTLSMTAWTGIYRVQSTTLTNAQRPVMSLTMSFANVTLAAGNYFAAWTVTGAVAPGNPGSIFAPSVHNADGTVPAGNALQSLDGGATYTPLMDAGLGIRVAMPLTVTGTAIPEPSSLGLMLLGGAGLAFGAIRSRRRQS
ncbi:MAG: PEP-CTERM sorting domain-containing protein [Chthoniobacterales bacterium]